LKGMKHIVLATPKSKGFTSVTRKAKTITLGQLDKFYKDGEQVSLKSLTSKRIINSKENSVKIVSSGELSKKLTIKNCKVSVGAKEKIEKAGGKIE